MNHNLWYQWFFVLWKGGFNLGSFSCRRNCFLKVRSATFYWRCYFVSDHRTSVFYCLGWNSTKLYSDVNRFMSNFAWISSFAHETSFSIIFVEFSCLCFALRLKYCIISFNSITMFYCQKSDVTESDVVKLICGAICDPTYSKTWRYTCNLNYTWEWFSSANFPDTKPEPDVCCVWWAL